MRRVSSIISPQSGWSMDSVEYLYLEGVSWELYEHLLKIVGNRPLRLNYDNGELEIISPLPGHENAGKVLGRLVEELTMFLDLLPFIQIVQQRGDQNAAIKAFRVWLKKQGWVKT